MTVSAQLIDDFEQKIDGQYPISYPAGKIQPVAPTADTLAAQNISDTAVGYDESSSAFIGNADLVSGFGYENDVGKSLHTFLKADVATHKWLHSDKRGVQEM